MTAVSGITVLLIAAGGLITAALFTLYQNPMMEILLANWALC